MQRLSPSRKNQDLFISAWTRNKANKSVVALHYFFNERTKAGLQSYLWWIGRNTLASSWICVTGSSSIPPSGQQHECFLLPFSGSLHLLMDKTTPREKDLEREYFPTASTQAAASKRILCSAGEQLCWVLNWSFAKFPAYSLIQQILGTRCVPVHV